MDIKDLEQIIMLMKKAADQMEEAIKFHLNPDSNNTPIGFLKEALANYQKAKE